MKLYWIGFLFFLFVCLGNSAAQETKTGNPYLKERKGEAWLDLMTGKIYTADFPMKPSGPILWGRLVNKEFEPSHIVDFARVASEPSSEFAPASIDLQTGKMIMEGNDSPPGPALRGRMDSKGYFHVYPSELKRWIGESVPSGSLLPPLKKKIPDLSQKSPSSSETLTVPETVVARPGPMLSAPRESGFTIELDQWWSEIKAPMNTDPLKGALTARDLTAIGSSLTGRRIGWDPLSGYIEIFWLDSEGNICHGDPGINGQPGTEKIFGTQFSEIQDLEDQKIDQAQLLRMRTDNYVFPRYQANGPHLAQFSVWYARVRGGSGWEDFDGSVVRTLTPIHSIPINVVLDSAFVSPVALHPSFDPNCSLSSTGLPIPDVGDVLGGPTQDPTKCLRKRSVSASVLINACREKILTGGLNAGYYRWTARGSSIPEQ